MIQLELPFMPENIKKHNELVYKYKFKGSLPPKETNYVFNVRETYDFTQYGCFIIIRYRGEWIMEEI